MFRGRIIHKIVLSLGMNRPKVSVGAESTETNTPRDSFIRETLLYSQKIKPQTLVYIMGKHKVKCIFNIS